jgi:hypothetical protein
MPFTGKTQSTGKLNKRPHALSIYMIKICALAVALFLTTVFPVYALEQEEREVLLIGTVHIFDVEGKMREKILEFKPDAIAVELDENFFSLMANWVKSKQAKTNGMGEWIGTDNASKEDLEGLEAYIRGLVWVYGAPDMRAGITIAQELDIPVYPVAPQSLYQNLGLQDVSFLSKWMLEGRVEALSEQKLLTLALTILEGAFLFLFRNSRLALQNSPELLISFSKNVMAFMQECARVLMENTTLMRPKILSSSPVLLIQYLLRIAAYCFSLVLLTILLYTCFVIMLPILCYFVTPEGITIMRRTTKLCPQFYSANIEKREEFMSNKIAQICKDHNKVVVITGLAHVDGLEEEIKKKVPHVRIETTHLFEVI